MISRQDAQLIRQSFNAMPASGQRVVEAFYDRLFDRAPAVRPLFANDMKLQSEKLYKSLALAVSSLNRLEELREPLQKLGAAHIDWGAHPQHYPVVADALIETLAETCSPAWSRAHENAWTRLLDFISDEMIRGARRASGQAA